MTVSQTAEYALRAVVQLAQHRGESLTTQQLSDATGVPASYLSKVLQPLARSGLISAQRGMHGGYSLQRDPAQISVLEIIECVAPHSRHAGHEHEADAETFSSLHELLDRVNADMEHKFASTHIDQIIDL